MDPNTFIQERDMTPEDIGFGLCSLCDKFKPLEEMEDNICLGCLPDA